MVTSTLSFCFISGFYYAHGVPSLINYFFPPHLKQLPLSNSSVISIEEGHYLSELDRLT